MVDDVNLRDWIIVRFGLTVGQGADWDVQRQLWMAADADLLWESVWTGDHFYPFLPGSDPVGPCLEGWISLASLAQHTERVRTGILVSGMPHRHPAVVAKMAAAADIASGGRLELGLGAAWYQAEMDGFGIELGSVRDRLDRLEEGVEVIHRLLTDPATTFSGRFYRLSEARCEPKALQTPRPPIVIGGVGERRTAAIVARWADHWNLGFAPPSEVPRKIDALERHCVRFDRDPNEITISVVVRTRRRQDNRPLEEVADEVAAYQSVGCQVAIIEARRTDTEACQHEFDLLSEALRSI